MFEKKKPKDVKDISTWDDGLGKMGARIGGGALAEPVATPEVPTKPEKKAKSADLLKQSKSEYVPSSEELEAEWEKKLKDAGKTEKELAKETAPVKRPETFEDVFRQLKQAEEPVTQAKAKKDMGRLDRIGVTVRGEAPEVTERELTGQKVSGIYKLYPMGTIPPLNLVSKIIGSFSKPSLERDLETANIPLYSEEYVPFCVGIGFIFSVFLFVFIYIITSFNIAFAVVALILSLLFISLLIVNIPSIQVKSGSREVDRQLPFALRHMSSLLSAGIGIFDSMVSVSKAEYGALSTELDRVAWDVKSGENLADALQDASDRIGSTSFNRVTTHIRRALQMGGDVAKIISQIADDMAFEMRMQISDFVEKLNAFMIVYLIGGIVGPVVIAVFSVVGSVGQFQSVGTAAAPMVDSNMLLFMVLFVFPMIMVMITYVVKVMEPKS